MATASVYLLWWGETMFFVALASEKFTGGSKPSHIGLLAVETFRFASNVKICQIGHVSKSTETRRPGGFPLNQGDKATSKSHTPILLWNSISDPLVDIFLGVGPQNGSFPLGFP